MSNIQVEKLTKTYGSGATAITALDHVNMTIKEGEFVAIMGPSGCGKSTLMHLLGGLDKPSEGHVIIGGHNLTDLNDEKLTELRRRKIGFIFQFFNLIPVLNAVENAALPITLDGVKAAESKKKAVEWLTRCLIERRDKIGRTYFPRVLPLDQFAVRDGRLQFEDLGAKYGLTPARQYTVRWARFDNRSQQPAPLAGSVNQTLPQEVAQSAAGDYFAAEIRAAEPSKSVTVYLRNKAGRIEVVGIDRTW